MLPDSMFDPTPVGGPPNPHLMEAIQEIDLLKVAEQRQVIVWCGEGAELVEVVLRTDVRVRRTGMRVQGTDMRVQRTDVRVRRTGVRVQRTGVRVWRTGVRVSRTGGVEGRQRTGKGRRKCWLD